VDEQFVTQIFQRIYPLEDVVKWQSIKQDNSLQYFAICGEHGLRWLVPTYSRSGKAVLSQWTPYKFTSRIKWKGLLFIYTIGLLGKMPGIKTVTFAPQKSGLQIPGGESSFCPVVYVGTSDPQQKAVVTLVSPGNSEPQAVMKVALGDRAQASLLREAMILKKLLNTSAVGAPILLAVEDNGRRTWQSVVGGRLTSRKLTQAHINWLLQLPRSDKSTTLNEQQKSLQHNFSRNPQLLGGHRRAVDAAIGVIQGGIIPLVFIHGDFAPWNLKSQPDGKIAAIDWEDADPAGFPLWDLCHFFLLQAHLFKERNPVKRLSTSPLVQQYFQGMGVDKKDFVALVSLYILLTAMRCNGSCSEEYKEFLLAQIPLVVAA